MKKTTTPQQAAAQQRQKLAMAASFHIIPFLVVTGQIFVFVLAKTAHLFPEPDALMNVIGTSAEIIAGLYGITLAGYTFFLSRIDALTATDATLDHIAGSVKQRFKFLIWYITATVATTLFICFFLMIYPVSSGVIPDYLYRVICIESLLFLVFSICLILYYSVGVIDPKCLEKEARRLKNRMDRRSKPPGNVTEFISLYDRIEHCCNALIPQPVLSQIQENKGRQFEYTIALLQDQKRLPLPLVTEIRRIHLYYECTVNCSPMSVSQQMVTAARQTLTLLERLGT